MSLIEVVAAVLLATGSALVIRALMVADARRSEGQPSVEEEGATPYDRAA